MKRHTLPFAAACLVLGLLACRAGAPETSAAPDATYRVRGEIVRMPAAGSREIGIHHEAIPDFKDEKGKLVGMDSMTMPFLAAPQVALGGFAVGDRVEFEFEVRWRGARPILLVRLQKLATGTRLAFDPEEAAPQPPPSSPQ
jgi:Cu/Ag efflux protein CusF